MFEVGAYIVHGNNGVCRIEEIGRMDTANTPKDKLYYTLCPIYVKGSKVFTPIDNKKVIMRHVMTKKEALDLIDRIEEIEDLLISDEKKREFHYKDAIKKCQGEELVKIIKDIYSRKESRIAEGKKANAGDEKYYHMAEEQLYGELAISLGMEKDEVKDFVLLRINKNKG